MYTDFYKIKKYKEKLILNILQNKNLDLLTKQKELEMLYTFSFKKLENSNEDNYKDALNLYKDLRNINWSNIPGKTFLKEFFKTIYLDSFFDFIVLRILLQLQYIYCKSLDFIKNRFLYSFKNYAYWNNIQITYEDGEKDNNKENVKKFSIDFINKCLAYIVEHLKELKFIEFDFELNKYILGNYKQISIQDALIINSEYWPLLVPGVPYNLSSFKGGYYIKRLTLLIENERIQNPLQVNQNCLNNINKLQEIKYTLVQNEKIIEFIKSIEDLFTPEFLNISYNNKYIEDWVACFQYLIFITGGIKNIYFPYILDFRGRIYNGIGFGLNPTTNKLSRALIGFGRIFLNDINKENLKKYLLTCFKNLSYSDIMNINLDFTDILNLKILISKYSLKSVIILLDWKENVLKTNETEILIEIDASQSGFQVLSLLSNDYQGMINTNLIKSLNVVDLYNQILEEVKVEINKKNKLWNKIINRDLIKRVVMTIPYGSTLQGQMEMFIDSFVQKYSLNYLVEINFIPLILESDILNNKDIILELIKINNNIKNFKIKDIDKSQSKMLFDLKKNTFKIILKIINEVTQKLYPNILIFTNTLKNLKLESINTLYYTFSLIYYKVIKDKMYIKKNVYTRSRITNKKDTRKMKVAAIANICQGMGDAFILHHVIDKSNFKFYPIHDAILINITDLYIVQNQILNTYNTIYNFLLNYPEFQKINISREKYELDSLEILHFK